MSKRLTLQTRGFEEDEVDDRSGSTGKSEAKRREKSEKGKTGRERETRSEGDADNGSFDVREREARVADGRVEAENEFSSRESRLNCAFFVVSQNRGCAPWKGDPSCRRRRTLL